jgi:hypothetical protein
MTFILPSFGASAISAVPGGGGGGGGGAFTNTYSLEFDGTDDYVALGNSSDLAPSSITISTWIKVTGSVATYNYIVSRAGSTYGSYHLRYTSSNKFNVHLGFASSAFKNDITSSSTYTLTDWHHVAFTYDQTNVKLYVDGVEEYSAAETRAIDYTAGGAGSDTHIGKAGGTLGYPQPSEGLIDEVAIFNTALSASQITNIYRGEDDGGSGGTNGVPGDLSTFNSNNGPVGWWRMGDNNNGAGATITDQGSGRNDGTIENGSSGNTSPTYSTDVPGATSSFPNTYSLNLDGTDDYMDIPDSTALETTAFTWSAWFYCTAINRYNIIVDTATASSSFLGYELFVVDTSNKIRFSSYHASDAIDSTTVVAANTWYHVAATHESGSDKLYVNGSLEASGIASSFGVSDAANLRIGGSSIFNLYHQGLIDEVSFFNSALSASDVSSIYNSGPNDISSLNPVGWWRMGDTGSDYGTATITNAATGSNSGGSSINGTIVNGSSGNTSPTYSTDTP